MNSSELARRLGVMPGGLGLSVRAVAVPGTGRSAGYYVGKPKGLSLRGLPVRKLSGNGSKPKA
jgi:hypothetical protein